MTNRTEAPERVYLDGDIEKGDGYWTRCFEDPKPCNEPAIEYTRTDLHQAEIDKAWNEAIEAAAAIVGASPSIIAEGTAKKIRNLKRETDQ